MSVTLEIKYNLFLQADGVWRLQAWTSRAENISPKVFVYQRLNSTPYEYSSRDMFTNIAQATDMVEYPDNSPDAESSFFRKEYMDVEIQDSELAYKSVARINNDVNALCRTLNQI